ncbi:MAG: hypothetical protein AB7O45_01630, partial [Alphaproteobacteria bacterium]
MAFVLTHGQSPEIAFSEASDIALTGDGGVFVFGMSGTTMDFDPGPGTEFRTGPGAFLARYDASGSPEWVNLIVGAQDAAMAKSSTGDLHVRGNFVTSADFDPGPGVV